jgi:predicted transcriptional regulator
MDNMTEDGPGTGDEGSVSTDGNLSIQYVMHQVREERQKLKEITNRQAELDKRQHNFSDSIAGILEDVKKNESEISNIREQCAGNTTAIDKIREFFRNVVLKRIGALEQGGKKNA